MDEASSKDVHIQQARISNLTNMNLNFKYYSRIAISALLIMISNFLQNTGSQIPYYVSTIAYLLIVILVPYAVWQYKKDRKIVAECDDLKTAEKLLEKITMKKMTLVHVPSGITAILFVIQPTESMLYAAIASLLLFVVFGKPEKLSDID